ncbi:MAG: hypothetical protein ABR519_08485 [Bacteroidales bacterium]
MKLVERIEPFIILGEIMAEAASAEPSSARAVDLRKKMDSMVQYNRWFTPENVKIAVEAISGVLTSEKITRWLEPYDLSGEHKPLTVGVIMAGNIPLVGFHDLITVLLSGNMIKARISSRDPELMESIIKILIEEEPRFKPIIEITGENPVGTEAVIATGSDNTSRYFEYHFGKSPHLFRKNRSSLAVLDSDTTRDELTLLGNDIFSFFGLGCRNVSRLLIPANFDKSLLTEAWESHGNLADHHGWQNNYIYEKALSTAAGKRFTDGGFFILRESPVVTSPLAVIHYNSYQHPDSVRQIIDHDRDKIQTIVGKGLTPFGRAQFPELWDYADNIDTMRFLLNIK